MCKRLNTLKVTDMFQSSLWKFYYKLNKSQLPPYFVTMLPTNYNIRLHTFHLPLIKHAFAEQRLEYELIKILNSNRSQTVIHVLKAQSLFFYGFKTFVKFHIIDVYADGCYDASCVTCHIQDTRYKIQDTRYKIQDTRYNIQYILFHARGP